MKTDKERIEELEKALLPFANAYSRIVFYDDPSQRGIMDNYALYFDVNNCLYELLDGVDGEPLRVSALAAAHSCFSFEEKVEALQVENERLRGLSGGKKYPADVTMPNGDRLQRQDSCGWTTTSAAGAVATNEQDWELVEIYGLDALFAAGTDALQSQLSEREGEVERLKNEVAHEGEHQRQCAIEWHNKYLSAETALKVMGEALKPFALLIDQGEEDDDLIPSRGGVHCLIYGGDELGELDCADFHKARQAIAFLNQPGAK